MTTATTTDPSADPHDHDDTAADVPLADTADGYVILDGQSPVCLDDLLAAGEGDR